MVSKPINSDSQMDENFSAMFQPPMHFSPDSPPAQISATQDLPVGKTFQYKVNIIYPPDICFLHRNCAGKHLLFIQGSSTFNTGRHVLGFPTEAQKGQGNFFLKARAEGKRQRQRESASPVQEDCFHRELSCSARCKSKELRIIKLQWQ